MTDITDLFYQINELVPGLESGLAFPDALQKIIDELKRLKEIEAKYEGLCK